jgi:hypothetical protein
MSLFNILWVVFSAIPFIVVTAIAENKPSNKWLAGLILAFAGFGYVSGTVVAQIVFALFAWHVIFCLASLADRKFESHVRTGLWHIGVLCTAYTVGYFIRNGF